VGKSNRMERRIQALRDKGSAFSMGIKKDAAILWAFPENKDIQRLSEALGRRKKAKRR